MTIESKMKFKIYSFKLTDVFAIVRVVPSIDLLSSVFLTMDRLMFGLCLGVISRFMKYAVG